ncbi:MAG: MerR family transcriptional regulator [Proteobacteria bacterium]|nr:MerR family transcriptional regulator [Pseudomonadota bacterium]
MSETSQPSLTCFTISAVERDTGLSKDILRMWERRYRFPQPDRDQHGERLYPGELRRNSRPCRNICVISST